MFDRRRMKRSKAYVIHFGRAARAEERQERARERRQHHFLDRQRLVRHHKTALQRVLRVLVAVAREMEDHRAGQELEQRRAAQPTPGAEERVLVIGERYERGGRHGRRDASDLLASARKVVPCGAVWAGDGCQQRRQVVSANRLMCLSCVYERL
jgi:hypothetical protein